MSHDASAHTHTHTHIHDMMRSYVRHDSSQVMSHVTCIRVSHVTHIWVSHVAYECDMLRTSGIKCRWHFLADDILCDLLRTLCTSYVTYEWGKSHMNVTYFRTMEWLRLVGSLKLQVSFAKEPYNRDDILQKRLIILRSLLIVAIP